MKQKKLIAILFFSISILLIAEVIWWNIYHQRLLSTNKELHLEKIQQNQAFDSERIAILEDYDSKLNMFISESIFFIMILLAGLYLLYRTGMHELKLNELQSNFLLSVTHELKTPLASIKLYFQTLLKKKNIDVAKKEYFLHKGIEDSNRLISLIENILLAGKDIEKIQIRASELIKINESIIKLSRDFQKDAQIHFNFNTDYYLAITETAFAIVFNNLISNAIKYNFSNPKRIDIYLENSDNDLILKVSDNGIGIPDALKNNIFEKFYRIEDESKRQTQGSGLGLFIVKKIVDLLKSKIEVSNNPKGGTVFVIRFNRQFIHKNIIS